MLQFVRLASWLWDRATGDGGDDEDDGSGATAFSALDASVNFAHGEPRNGVRELQRANEHADELEDAHRDER